MARSRANQPVVGAAMDPATGGYWLAVMGGGVSAFDAPACGSLRTGVVAITTGCVSARHSAREPGSEGMPVTSGPSVPVPVTGVTGPAVSCCPSEL
jgi:hypothetical protein